MRSPPRCKARGRPLGKVPDNRVDLALLDQIFLDHNILAVRSISTPMTTAVTQAMTQLSLLLSPDGIRPQSLTEGDPFLYHRFGNKHPERIRDEWFATLQSLESARVALLGVPSDNGAAYHRGSKLGPYGLRMQFASKKNLYERLAEAGVIDIGDVISSRLFIRDDLVPQHVIDSLRERRWGSQGAEFELPISPHSMLERTLDCLRTINPQLRVMLIGGDHSISQVPTVALAQDETNASRDLGILQIDAHPDLSLGVEGLSLGYEAWAYHANQALGGAGRMQQVGIRVANRKQVIRRADGLGIRQYWAAEFSKNNADALIAEVMQKFRDAGVRRLYLSNDIDGTDYRWAAATGVPTRARGLHPAWVSALIAAAGEQFEVVGADLMEVAPLLNLQIAGEPVRTLQTAAHYVYAHVEALYGDTFGSSNPFELPTPAPQSAPLEVPYTSEGHNPFTLD